MQTESSQTVLALPPGEPLPLAESDRRIRLSLLTETAQMLLRPTADGGIQSSDQVPKFGIGSYCKMPPITASDLLHMACIDRGELIDSSEPAGGNGGPETIELMNLAGIDVAVTDQVLKFGGYRVMDERPDRRISFDTVYVLPFWPEGDDVIVSIIGSHILRNLLAFEPDENDLCPELGPGWRRLWWD